MSEQQPKEIPEWARQERTADLAWIEDNVHLLWPIAQQGYQTVGRGAMVVDTTDVVPHETGTGHPCGYFDQQTLTQLRDPDLLRLVDAYQPDSELVTALLKTADRISSYRLRLGTTPGREHLPLRTN